MHWLPKGLILLNRLNLSCALRARHSGTKQLQHHVLQVWQWHLPGRRRPDKMHCMHPRTLLRPECRCSASMPLWHLLQRTWTSERRRVHRLPVRVFLLHWVYITHPVRPWYNRAQSQKLNLHQLRRRHLSRHSGTDRMQDMCGGLLLRAGRCSGAPVPRRYPQARWQCHHVQRGAVRCVRPGQLLPGGLRRPDRVRPWHVQ